MTAKHLKTGVEPPHPTCMQKKKKKKRRRRRRIRRIRRGGEGKLPAFN
jgi:hypothetical protein